MHARSNNSETVKRPVYFWDDLPIVWPMMIVKIYSVIHLIVALVDAKLAFYLSKSGTWPGFQKAL